MQRWVALAVVVVLGGCATPQMTAGDLARRADQNMLEAQQNLAGKNVIVSGVVKSTSLAPRAQMVMVGPGTAARTQEQDSVAFKCEVKHFESVEKMAVSVLSECRRSK